MSVANERTLLLFQVGGETLALPAEQVSEVLSLPALSRPPGLPPLLEGFLNLGGAAVPVVALDRLFALRETPRGLYTPLLLLDSRAGPLALLVDRVTELAQVPAESLAPVGSGAALNDCAAAEVRWKGVVGHLLSLERLLLVQEQRRLDELRLQEQNRLAVLEESA